MRVVGGELGGRPLRAPAGHGTRPTSDLVRGALFDALTSRLQGEGGLAGRAALDLFAGSGALGIEALSRGCSAAWFVEVDREALAVLRANLDALGVAGRARVLPHRVERVTAGRELDGVRFDLVLADPPYASGAGPVLRMLANSPPWLLPGALCALEHAAREELPPVSGTLHRMWQRAYGGTALSVYAAEGAVDSRA